MSATELIPRITVISANPPDCASPAACKLVCVDPARVDEVWPHVREFIESAFRHERGDDDADVVLADLKAKRALLWIVWAGDDRKILAALTTMLIKVTRGLICRITSCGGVALGRWQHVIDDIEAFAKAEGCFCVRLEGRRGWQAILPDYSERWITLEKRLS